MAITDKAALPAAVADYYDRLVLMTAYPALIHDRFAQKRMLPKKMGDNIVFRRYARLSTVPIPLVDGVTPPGVALSVSDIKAAVDFYGNFVTITNQVEYTVEDDVLNQAARLLGQNMGETVDELTRDVLASAATVVQCSEGVNGQTPTELTKSDIDGMAFTLLGNDAQFISKVVKANQNVSTSAVRPAFFGFIDTGLLDDLEAVSGFKNTANYPTQDPIMENEWGQTGNTRWLYSSIGIVSSAATPVYSCPFVGQEAYAAVHLGSDTGEFYIEPLGSAGSADPLHQRGTVGWQFPYVARILNDNFMGLLLATHTA